MEQVVDGAEIVANNPNSKLTAVEQLIVSNHGAKNELGKQFNSDSKFPLSPGGVITIIDLSGSLLIKLLKINKRRLL